MAKRRVRDRVKVWIGQVKGACPFLLETGAAFDSPSNGHLCCLSPSERLRLPNEIVSVCLSESIGL